MRWHKVCIVHEEPSRRGLVRCWKIIDTEEKWYHKAISKGCILFVYLKFCSSYGNNSCICMTVTFPTLCQCILICKNEYIDISLLLWDFLKQNLFSILVRNRNCLQRTVSIDQISDGFMCSTGHALVHFLKC